MPVVAFVSLDSVHNPASGGVAPASWFTTIESNFRSLVGRVGCQLTEDAAQDVASPGTTTITLGDVEWNNGMTTGAVANAITVPSSYAGKYLISANLRLTSIPGGANFVTLDVANNGGVIFREYADRSSATGSLQSIAAAFEYDLAVGDDLTLVTTVSSNISDADTEISVSLPTLTAIWLNA